MTDDAADQALDEWLQTMSLRLERLRHLLPTLSFDFTRQSLLDVEEDALRHFAGMTAVYASANRERAELLTRYLGESYRRVAGGIWSLEDVEGARRLLLRPDVRCTEPVDPLQLIVMAVDRRTGEVFARRYDELRVAAEQRAREEPGWTPRRIRVDGLDLPEVAQTPELSDWLRTMETVLRQWCARFEGWGPWDYSPDSLDRLEDRVLAESQWDEDADDVMGDQFFKEGAVRYLGETFRRHGGGRWVYEGTTPDPDEYFVGRPYVLREDEFSDPRYLVPIIVIGRLLRKRAAGTLRRALAGYAGKKPLVP